MKNLPGSAALLTAVVLAACSADSPTASEFSPSFAKHEKACVFATPNGKTHSLPATSNRCERPFPPSLIGTYVPNVLIAIQDGERIDALALGVQFELVLNQDGTTSGLFYAAPNPGEEGSGLDLDLAGTFTFENGTVVVVTDAFGALPPLAFENNTLSGAGSIGSDDPLGLELVLVKK